MGLANQAPKLVCGTNLRRSNFDFATEATAAAGSTSVTAIAALAPRRRSRDNTLPTLLTRRGTNRGRECIAAVAVAGELVEGRTGGGQQHRVPRARQAGSGRDGLGHHP